MSGRLLVYSLPTIPGLVCTSYGVISYVSAGSTHGGRTYYDGKLQGCLLYVCGIASDARVFNIEAGAETFV
jgi:hypothetical protein